MQLHADFLLQDSMLLLGELEILKLNLYIKSTYGSVVTTLLVGLDSARDLMLKNTLVTSKVI